MRVALGFFEQFSLSPFCGRKDGTGDESASLPCQ